MLKEKFRLVGGTDKVRQAERDALKNLIEYSLGCAIDNGFVDTQVYLKAALQSLENDNS